MTPLIGRGRCSESCCSLLGIDEFEDSFLDFVRDEDRNIRVTICACARHRNVEELSLADIYAGTGGVCPILLRESFYWYSVRRQSKSVSEACFAHFDFTFDMVVFGNSCVKYDLPVDPVHPSLAPCTDLKGSGVTAHLDSVFVQR